VIAQSENVVAAQVEWEHRDSDGQAIGSEGGIYMLSRRNDTRLPISVYVPISAGS
jgi:hypothetical protein